MPGLLALYDGAKNLLYQKYLKENVLPSSHYLMFKHTNYVLKVTGIFGILLKPQKRI